MRRNQIERIERKFVNWKCLKRSLTTTGNQAYVALFFVFLSLSNPRAFADDQHRSPLTHFSLCSDHIVASIAGSKTEGHFQQSVIKHAAEDEFTNSRTFVQDKISERRGKITGFRLDDGKITVTNSFKLDSQSVNALYITELVQCSLLPDGIPIDVYYRYMACEEPTIARDAAHGFASYSLNEVRMFAQEKIDAHQVSERLNVSEMSTAYIQAHSILLAYSKGGEEIEKKKILLKLVESEVLAESMENQRIPFSPLDGILSAIIIVDSNLGRNEAFRLLLLRDNLSFEQRLKVIRAVNFGIQHELLKARQFADFVHNYSQELLPLLPAILAVLDNCNVDIEWRDLENMINSVEKMEAADQSSFVLSLACYYDKLTNLSVKSKIRERLSEVVSPLTYRRFSHLIKIGINIRTTVAVDTNVHCDPFFHFSLPDCTGRADEWHDPE